MEGQILTPWMYRRWRFDFPTELYPSVLERLRGTPARAEEFVRGMWGEDLRRGPADGWSIQRHIAHLSDLERLLHARLDAYEGGSPVLPAADMTNDCTVRADHDAREIVDVLAELRRTREASVERLEGYPRDFFGRSACTSAWASRSAWSTRASSSRITTTIISR